MMRRIPNYKGYWSLILDTPTNMKSVLQTAVNQAEIPSPDPLPTLKQANREFRVKDLGLPPAIPTDCCMSGCAHCVWDNYYEAVKQWEGKRIALMAERTKNGQPNSEQGKDAAGPPPQEIAIDPTMKAFLELERKLSGQSN